LLMVRGVSKAAIIAVVVVVIVLAAAAAFMAGQAPQPQPPAEKAEAPQAPKPTEKAPEKAEAKPVVVYSGWGGPEGEAFESALSIFVEEYKIPIDRKKVDKIWDQITSELRAGRPRFDVAVLPWPIRIVELGQRGLLVPLDDIVEKLKDKVVDPYFIEVVKARDGHYYAVPIKMWSKPGLWVNIKALERVGLKPEDIKTIDDLKEACRKLLEAGIQPMASGAADKWPLSDIFEHVILSIGGPELHDALIKDPKAWGRPEVKEAFKTLAELLKMGCYGPKEKRISEKWEAQVVKLVRGEVAMYLMGNWINLFIEARAKELGVRFEPGVNYTLIPFPLINTGLEKRAVIAGGDWAIVPQNSPNPEGALKLAEWLGGAEYQEAMVRRGGYLAVNREVPLDAYKPGDRLVMELILEKGFSVVPDLDDNLRPSKLQQFLWDKLYELWSNPDDWERIYEEVRDTMMRELQPQ